MELPPSTFTSRLSTFSLELIDRPFDHRPIGKERFDKPPDLVSQMKKGLPKLTEFFSILFCSVCPYFNSIQILKKLKKKMNPPNISLTLESKVLSRSNSDPCGLTTGRQVPPLQASLLSELQWGKDFHAPRIFEWISSLSSESLTTSFSLSCFFMYSWKKVFTSSSLPRPQMGTKAAMTLS